jgi:hypothetical protein
MYGYESSVTLTTDRLHYRLQTRPLRGRPKAKREAIVRQRKGESSLVMSPKGVPDTKTDRPTDRRS